MKPRNGKRTICGGVLSVDLAHKVYDRNGIAYMAPGSDEVRLITTSDLGLRGKPSARAFADALNTFSIDLSVSALLLDGPQGWRYPKSQIDHMRLCERVLNTPGKTGNPGSAKPRNYLAFIQFSIDLFSHLRKDHGWDLLNADWYRQPGTRWLVETFPSAAWRTLGLQSLPAKNKAKEDHLRTWRRNLSMITDLQLPLEMSHDELQASVVLPIGRAITENRRDDVILSGLDPFVGEDDIVYEGWIALPHAPGI